GAEKTAFKNAPNPTGPGGFTASPSYKDPVTDRITLGADRELFANTAVGIEGTYAKANNLARLNDPNLAYCTSCTRAGCAQATPNGQGFSTVNGQQVYSTVRPNPFYG